ncbi:MAG: outer membrane beta-barrel protein [Helicobacter sp.]|nr:outer membrane beta-barrel protein [Helicobacter sp.]
MSTIFLPIGFLGVSFFGVSFAEEQAKSNIDFLTQKNVQAIYDEFNFIRSKSGHYFGGGIGFSSLLLHQNVIFKNEMPVPVILMLKGGTQSFFTRSVGIRGFLALDFANSAISYNRNKNISSSFLLLSLGLDLMVDFDISKDTFLGGFFGVGLGSSLNINKDSKVLISNIILQSGLNFTFLDRNQISLGIKTTPFQRGDKTKLLRQIDLLPFVNYSFKFF